MDLENLTGNTPRIPWPYRLIVTVNSKDGIESFGFFESHREALEWWDDYGHEFPGDAEFVISMLTEK